MPPKPAAIDRTNKFQPSMSTKSISLNGIEIPRAGQAVFDGFGAGQMPMKIAKAVTTASLFGYRKSRKNAVDRGRVDIGSHLPHIFAPLDAFREPIGCGIGIIVFAILWHKYIYLKLNYL